MDDGIRSEIQKLKQIAAENVVAAEIALKEASVVSMEIEGLRRTGEASPCPSGLENECRVVEEPFSGMLRLGTTSTRRVDSVEVGRVADSRAREGRGGVPPAAVRHVSQNFSRFGS